MSTVECPYFSDCAHMWEYDGDCEDFTQDSEHEFECPECKRPFMATVYWDINFTGERIPKPGDKK